MCLYAVDKLITFISKRSNGPGQEERVQGIAPGSSEPGVRRENTRWKVTMLLFKLWFEE